MDQKTMPKSNNAPSNEGYIPPTKRHTSPKIAGLRRWLRSKLLAAPGEFDLATTADQEHRKTIIERLQILLRHNNIQLVEAEHQELEEGLINDLLGFGAIEPLVQDRSYSEIMVNGPGVIFAERKGKMEETEFVFDDEEHVQYTAQRIARPLQREFNRRNPMVDARLPDGSRVHLIMPPSALQGTTVQTTDSVRQGLEEIGETATVQQGAS